MTGVQTCALPISQTTGDDEKMMALLKEYQEMQTLRNTIAKELGNEIIV